MVSAACVACNDSAVEPLERSYPFSIIAEQAKTRTVTDESGTTSWQRNDKIHLFHSKSSGGESFDDGAFIIEDATTGRASGMLAESLEESGSYTWTGVYPYIEGSMLQAYPVTIGAAEQTQNGNDNISHFAGTSAPLFGAGASSGTTEPTLEMGQIASGLKIIVSNKTEKSIKIAKITVTTPETIVGEFNADLTGTNASLSPVSGKSSKTVTLTVQDPTFIKKNNSSYYAILLAPCTITGAISIEVTTTAGASETIEKNISGGLEFAAGKLNSTTVEFTAAAPEVPGEEPEAYGACPTEAQVAWQRQELIMFYHFGPATFSGFDGEKANYSAEELISQYKPTTIDANQWVSVAKECGFKEVILTAKHHDGFSLWDNPESTCDIAAEACENKTDVVKAVSEAAKKNGLSFGIYMSPWDKINGNANDYGSKYVYAIDSVADGEYGTLTEFWLDGNNATSLDFNAVNQAILEKNPNCIIFSNVGPGCRWVGNENGEAGETNWSTFSPSAHGASQTVLPKDFGSCLSMGDQGGSSWIPAECDLSIRPIGDNNGWFWGPDETPKSAKELLDIYYKSVGRNSVMLLNVPPTTGGVLDDADVVVLKTFHEFLAEIFTTNLAAGATIDEDETTEARGTKYEAENVLDGNESTYWAVSGDDTKSATLVLDLEGEKKFNVVSLQEFITKGQRVTGFSVEYYDGSWHNFARGTTIGAKRLVKKPSEAVTASRLRITFSALACPLINEIGLYLDNIDINY